MQNESKFAYDKMCKYRSKLAVNRRKKVITHWDTVSSRMSNLQFRCMFRMTRPWFEELYFTIIGAIRESKYKSQACIDTFLSGWGGVI